MNKKLLKIILTVTILVAILTSCKMLERTIDNIETPEGDKSLEMLIGCLESHDYTEFEEIIVYDGSKQDFLASMNSIDEFYNGEMIDYKKIGYYINSNTLNGKTTISKDYTYEVETTEDIYYINIVRVGNSNEMKVTALNINTKSAAQASVTPSRIGSNAWQIVILVYTILCYIFIIYVIVLCAKSKVRLKWLWIIGILLQSGISVSIAQNSFRFNAHVVYLGISRYLIYKDGSFVLTILFPLIAFMFILLRKYLIKRAEDYRNRKNNSVEALANDCEKLDSQPLGDDSKE